VAAACVETLIAGNTFSSDEAMALVTNRLNYAGFREPSGRLFRAHAIAEWHRFVLHHARAGYLERDVYDHLMATRPDHASWDRAQLLAWIDVCLSVATEDWPW
jgi:hypothetical protein